MRSTGNNATLEDETIIQEGWYRESMGSMYLRYEKLVEEYSSRVRRTHGKVSQKGLVHIRDEKLGERMHKLSCELRV